MPCWITVDVCTELHMQLPHTFASGVTGTAAISRALKCLVDGLATPLWMAVPIRMGIACSAVCAALGCAVCNSAMTVLQLRTVQRGLGRA
jgi:hypothetical protein